MALPQCRLLWVKAHAGTTELSIYCVFVPSASSFTSQAAQSGPKVACIRYSLVRRHVVGFWHGRGMVE